MGCCQSSAGSPPASGNISQSQPATQTDGTGGVPVQDQRPGRVSITSYNGSVHAQGSAQSPLSPVPELPPGPHVDLGKVFIARYAYQARTAEDLSFEKGEQLTVSYSSHSSTTVHVSNIVLILVLCAGNRQHRWGLVDGKILQDKQRGLHPQQLCRTFDKLRG